MKKNKGITLIALVVTIVVLLILAAVSISMLTGENGVITQAQRARTENRGGTVEERVNLWKSEVRTSRNTGVPVDGEDEMLQKLLDEKLVEEEEIDRDVKIITIGERDIDYSMTLRVSIYNPDTANYIYIEYEEGMTWMDFINSEYNNDVGMYISSNQIRVDGHLIGKIEGDLIKDIYPEDQIKNDETYFLVPNV